MSEKSLWEMSRLSKVYALGKRRGRRQVPIILNIENDTLVVSFAHDLVIKAGWTVSACLDAEIKDGIFKVWPEKDGRPLAKVGSSSRKYPRASVRFLFPANGLKGFPVGHVHTFSVKSSRVEFNLSQMELF